ncbi:MAG: hypothetical protein ABR550_09570 [Wenzhouxiangellaceae bacterium]
MQRIKKLDRHYRYIFGHVLRTESAIHGNNRKDNCAGPARLDP